MRSTAGSWTRRAFVAGIGGAGLAGWAGMAGAQAFPSRPVKIVVPWAAGGAGDVMVRLLAPVMSERLGQPVVVENRPGATGSVGSAFVAKSPGDGYTLVYAGADSHSVYPHLFKQAPYDVKRDFTAIAPIGFLPYALAVHPGVPANSLGDFVKYARAANPPLAYGSWGVGSSAQILVESFKEQTGVEMLHVPYQGAAPLMLALMAGQISVAILPMPIVEQQASKGSIKLLGLIARERMEGMPNLPTMREQGVPLDSGVWTGILGPAKMPPDVVAKLHDAVQAAVRDPANNDKLKKLFLVPDTAEQGAYQSYINSEADRWGAIIRTAKISLE